MYATTRWRRLRSRVSLLICYCEKDTKVESWARALCEEIDSLEAKVERLEKKVDSK